VISLEKPRVIQVREKTFEEALPPEENGWKIIFARSPEATPNEKKGFFYFLKKIFG
jgi:hypothetical protein